MKKFFLGVALLTIVSSVIASRNWPQEPKDFFGIKLGEKHDIPMCHISKHDPNVLCASEIRPTGETKLRNGPDLGFPYEFELFSSKERVVAVKMYVEPKHELLLHDLLMNKFGNYTEIESRLGYIAWRGDVVDVYEMKEHRSLRLKGELRFIGGAVHRPLFTELVKEQEANKFRESKP